MQLRNILAMALIAGALPAAAACGARSTTLDGYGDGSGDEDDDGGTSTTSTSGTTTWSTSSTWTDTWTTSSTWTDTWTTTTTQGPCDVTSPDCSSCQECAINGACNDEVIICQQNVECVSLLGCVNDCDASCANDPDPQFCFDTCVNGPGGCAETYTGGIQDLNALLSCVFEDECPTICDGWF